jgi:RNA polymerase sigma factor (sigma-70 family)
VGHLDADTGNLPGRADPGTAGDPVVVLQRVYPALIGMARSLVALDAAEDLVQESLVQVLVRYPRFDGLSSPLAYSKTVLARLAYRGRDRYEVSADVSDLLGEGRGDFSESVALREIVLAALAQLPTRQRACVYLRYVEGLDDRQAGRVLGCRPVTVRTQTSRALKSLRPYLLEHGVTHV